MPPLRVSSRRPHAGEDLDEEFIIEPLHLREIHDVLQSSEERTPLLMFIAAPRTGEEEGLRRWHRRQLIEVT